MSMSFKTKVNLNKASGGKFSNTAPEQSLAGRKRGSQRAHPNDIPVSVIASSTKKNRFKKSKRSSKAAQPGDSASSVKSSSRRRRRSLLNQKKMTWTAPRRRRSASLTAQQTIIPMASSPDMSPGLPEGTPGFKASALSQQLHIKHSSKAKAHESVNIETLHEKAKSMFTIEENASENASAHLSTQLISSEDTSSSTLPGILLHLSNQVEEGSSAVLFLCALLTLGVLMVGGAVLCAGLADDGHHPQRNDENSNVPSIWRQQEHAPAMERYSIESQGRRSGSWTPPADLPRPSSHFVAAHPQPLSSAVLPSAPSNLSPTATVPGLLPTPQPKPKQTEKTAKREDVSKDSKAADHLCPSLVVPSGMEFVFAVREELSSMRQELNFNIVDLKGAPLSRVVVSEKGDINTAGCGIFLQTLTRMPLAMVDMRAVHEKSSRTPLICRPNGEVFGQLKHDESGRYMLKNKAGKGLLIFHGDFAEKAVNVMNTVGKLVCATERCVVDFDSSPHYQVRIAPYVDAGLVICGLLTIDKLEAKNERSP